MKRDAIDPWHKILISLDEAAALAGVGRRVVERWRQDQDFPSFIDGEGDRGNCKIHRSLFDKWLENRAKMRIGERMYV